MGFDYDNVAPQYDAHRKVGGPYIPELVKWATRAKARRVVELGAGTGQNTLAFAEAYPCELTCVERSAGMLAEARRKGVPGKWLRGCATAIPIGDASAEFLFAVYVLQHLPNYRTALMESYRVLDSGCAAFVTAPHAFIQNHPMNAYFPSFAAVDLARFPAEDKIMSSLGYAGFVECGITIVEAEAKPIDAAYVDRVANKFISTYALLPLGEFEEGLARLRSDVAKHGALAPLAWQAAVVWGRKP
jgi:ubiquinone/menaquinone biosynthesis C-methylase UbiE